jgi:cysteine desulfurase
MYNGKEEIKLTHFSHGMGCGCKMRPHHLEKILADLPESLDHNLIVGTSSSDDAAVYRLNSEQAIVQTIDFFTPIVDDPYDFGAIAAANAISDIYAMGARPLFALNIVAFPASSLPEWVLLNILKGAADIAQEAGIGIVGGHSIDDPEPKFGLCVTGIVHPDKVLKNCNAKPGDLLILTKPLGTGIISTAIRKGIASSKSSEEAIGWMKTLNKQASETILRFPVNACTDVTGFGLLGHLSEMTRGSGIIAEVWFDKIPFMEGVSEYALAGAIPGGTKGNREYYSRWIDWDPGISETDQMIICDAQTSGGLLVAVPETHAFSLLDDLKANGIDKSAIIGKVTGRGVGNISVQMS